MNVVCYLFVMYALFNFSETYASKYSEEANMNLDEEERPFRIAKVNMVWEKAKKRISGLRLAELYADLKIHDKEQLSLKKYKAENLDEDGLKEAAVNTKFRNIIDTYQLQEHFKTDKRYVNSANDVPLETERDTVPEFTDRKLQKIWKKALMTGFDAEELDKLKEEFWHQQMKLDEYNNLLLELDETEDTSDNSIERFKKTEMDPKSLKEKHADMKDVHKKIRDGYLKLESLTVKKDLEFQDPRVYQLWALAQKANMSEKDLESFRMELKHFEHRITKYEYIKEQVYYSKQSLKDVGKDRELEDKHLELEEKEKHYALKVKKLHTDLKKIVDKAIQHSEL
ncbi:alpha-2-macroglobulin receptor-associated protein-like [Gigantopelta aegis]|uniref:alpha-2-macroglobulin receptor-associated protein-like n=1 Tax=Gigantopelta aegis TaxID=1735272 RepID=UPI001B88C430|nr:alpha-2-macroglobulin receptor-associated protein-like [Gigantopelta aegis]